jgi:hypothetical protein
MGTRVCTRCSTEKPISEMAARLDRKNRRGHCKTCQQTYLKEYHAIYREVPENKERQKQATVAWRKGLTKDQRRHKSLVKNFGISLSDYEGMLVRQDGGCAICRIWEPFTVSGAFPVDHDHSTGAIRQLLCLKCNQALGLFNENPAAMEAAATYVRKHERLGKAG